MALNLLNQLSPLGSSFWHVLDPSKGDCLLVSDGQQIFNLGLFRGTQWCLQVQDSECFPG